MQSPTLQLPGSYLRLIVAGSQGIAARPLPMSEIPLNQRERTEIAEVVGHHLTTNLEHLTVEQRAQWGALVLFLAASSSVPGTLDAPLDLLPTLDQLETIQKGAELLQRLQVMGSVEAFRAFRASVEARGGPRPNVRLEEEAAGPRSPYLIEAESLRPVLGRHRIRVRVLPGWEEVLEGRTVTVTLLVPSRPDVSLFVEDAPGGTLGRAGVTLEVGDEWTEILFQATGSVEDEVELHVALVGDDATESCKVDEPFRVSRRRRR